MTGFSEMPYAKTTAKGLLQVYVTTNQKIILIY
jgi:hypothetical protein